MNPALSFEAVYGSHNYKLNHPDSNEDIMYYYNPLFKHVYDMKLAESDIVGLSTDRNHHDVRKLPELFYKANLYVLETLYSYHVVKHDGLYDSLLHVRDDISSMNLPQFFDSCMSLFHLNYQNFQRDKNYLLIEDHSTTYERQVGKHAASSLRVLDLIVRYASSDFKNFGSAMSYDSSVKQDKAFIKIYKAMNNGELSESDMEIRLKEHFFLTNELKHHYKVSPLKEDVNQYVMKIVERHVREQLFKELNAF